MPALKVTAQGQVTSRKDVLKHLGVRPGEKLGLELLPEGKGAIQTTRKKGKIEDIFGILKGKTNVKLTIEEMDQAIANATVKEFLRGVKR